MHGLLDPEMEHAKVSVNSYARFSTFSLLHVCCRKKPCLLRGNRRKMERSTVKHVLRPGSDGLLCIHTTSSAGWQATLSPSCLSCIFHYASLCLSLSNFLIQRLSIVCLLGRRTKRIRKTHLHWQIMHEVRSESNETCSTSPAFPWQRCNTKCYT